MVDSKDDDFKNFKRLIELALSPLNSLSDKLRRMTVEDLGLAIQFLQEALRENPDVAPEFQPKIDWQSLTDSQLAEIKLHDGQIKNLIRIMQNEVKIAMEKRVPDPKITGKRPDDP